MNVDQVALPNIANAVVERQIADRLNDSIATAVEKTFVDAFQLAAESVASQKKSTLNVLIDVPIFRFIESGQLDSYLKARLSTLVDSSLFMDSIIWRIMTQKSFITTVAQFVRSTVHQQA